MNKGTDNLSFNERNSLTGNSGMLGLPNLKPTRQPIRIKAFLDMYPSDEEDSEDKGKDSSESECEDIQPLPEDNDHKSKGLDATIAVNPHESNSLSKNGAYVHNSKSEHVQNLPTTKSNIETDEEPGNRLSRHFSDNFCMNETQRRENKIQKATSLCSESEALLRSQQDRLRLSSSNRRSNVKLEVPETLAETPLFSSNMEVSSYSCNMSKSRHLGSKFEALESAAQPRETHANPVLESHLSASSKAHSLHFVTETPLKNNPPIGSMRPTPSTSHRNIFQTPQNKLQDYGKNSVHTPATIFGNWSMTHMAQTPLQNRPTSGEGHSRSSVAPQLLSNHDVHQYRSKDEKKVRRPLTESLQSVQSNQYSQIDKHLSQYSGETGPSKNYDLQNHPLDHIPEKSSRSLFQESKENRHPANNEEKVTAPPKNYELHNYPVDHVPELSSRSSIYESKENRYPRNVEEKLTAPPKNFELINHPLDNVVEKSNRSSIHESKDNRHPRNIEEIKEEISKEKINESKYMESKKKSEIDVPKYEERDSKLQDVKPAISRAMEIKKDIIEGQGNVQASIPSRRRRNYGEIIKVKNKEYIILGTLGEGMSGQVLRVQDTTSLELRAIKIVDLSRMDKDCAQGCLQEISMLHKLQAPCIVRMFDYEIKCPMVHVVMEMGDTDFKNLLQSMTEEKKRIPLTMILYYWTEMLTAVKHIHDNGVIHSDLKPANFLLVRGRLKLIDFGIASSMNTDMTSVVKSNPIGTLNYISPEAVMDSNGSTGDSPNRTVKYKISFKSDVWSLGCILYSLVYGYTPFHNIRSPWAKVNAITNPDPKISFAIPPGSDMEPPPPILIDVMKKCFQHDPKARPTVAELLKIRYIPTKQPLPSPAPDIPPNILMKIKYSLSDSEWRQFTEIMETRRNQ